MPPNKKGHRDRKNGPQHSAVNGPGRPPPTMALALLSASLFCAFLFIVLPPTRGAQLDQSLEPEDPEKMDWLLRRLDGSEIGRKFVDSSSESESSAGDESSSAEEEAKRKRGPRATKNNNKISKFGDLLEEETKEFEEEGHNGLVHRRSHSAGGNTELAQKVESKFKVDPRHPIHILFPLPTDEGRKNENPFGITILKAKPVVDEAVEEVYRRQLVPPNSLSIHFEDSMLSDAHGPNVAINQLVDNQLDCIIGYAFVYALAPVARMSPFWRDKDSNGIPVITSVGLTSNLDNRREYQLMTRISSPYKVVKDAVMGFFDEMGWIKSAYLFHEQRYDATNPSIPYGECYLLMASVQPHLYRANRMEHNYFMFNELNYDHKRMNDNLKKASELSNGLPFNVILILPERESNNDKFGLTVSKVRPVIDIAIEDVIKHGRMPPGWINITYHDSRYWEDTLLAERVSATGVIQAYCEKRLDAILGFADAYSLATVSKISAGFGEGVPVLTTTGLTSIIGSKKSYPYVTRMRGSYTQMAEAAYKFVAQHEEEEEGQQMQQKSSINLNYQKILFMYHDKRRAINKPSSGNRRGESGGGPEESPSSSCYFSLYAIKEYFQDHPIYLEAWRKTPTPNVAFDEELPRSREEVAEWVKLASIRANGKLRILGVWVMENT